MKFPSHFIASFMVAVLLSLVVLSPAMPSKGSTSYIEPISYSGSFSDFQAYLSAESLSIDVCLWILGFITLCVVTSRNVDLNLNLTTTSSFQDKLTAYGNYACSHLWSSVKDIAYGIISWQNANNCFSWSSLTQVGFSNLLNLVKTVSFEVGDFVYSPSDTADDLLNISGVTGSVVTSSLVPKTSIFQELSLLAFSGIFPSGFGTLSRDYSYLTHYNSFSFNGANAIIYSRNNIYFYYFNGSSFTFRNNVTFNVSEAMFNGTYPNFTVSFTSSNVNTTPGLLELTSPYSDFDIYYILSYFASLGLYVYFTNNNLSYGSSYVLGTQGITPYSVGLPATVNTDSNYLVFPSAEDITVDFTTVPDRLADLTDTSTVNQRVEALTNVSADTIVSATDSSIGNINTPTYDFPSLGDVWKYPRYLFNLTRPFLLLCKDSLDAVTVGEGGLSWLFFGAFVMAVCGGVIGKFLE